MQLLYQKLKKKKKEIQYNQKSNVMQFLLSHGRIYSSESRIYIEW